MAHDGQVPGLEVAMHDAAIVSRSGTIAALRSE